MDKLILEYKGLVHSIARSYQKSGVPLEDLVQEGMMGLLQAQKRYDVSKQVKFSTYAVFWIKKYILGAIEQEYRNNLQIVDLKEGHLEEVADHSVEPDSATILDGDKLRLPPDIPEMEASILRLSFEQQKTIKEIASLLGISVEKVKQLRQKALRRVKSIRK